MRICFVGSWLP